MNPSERIDRLIAELTDWRGKTFASIRKSILEADREIIEEWKWMGSPVWSHDGIIAVANAHKGKVKLTFSHGASLPDPDKHFVDKINQNFTATFIFRTYQGERLVQEETEPLSMSYYTYPHLRALFLLTGLEIVEEYGSFERTPLDNEAQQMIFVLKRRS